MIGRREEGKDPLAPLQTGRKGTSFWGHEDGLVKSCSLDVQGQCGKDSINTHILPSILGRIGVASGQVNRDW